MSNRTSRFANPISRRAILRGAGVSMALPWLPSFALAETTGPGAFPKRFGVLFMGNGVNEDHWDAQGSGAEMKLSKTLEPLEPLKHKINVIHGLFHKRATGQGIHPAQTGSLDISRTRSRYSSTSSGTATLLPVVPVMVTA